MYVSFKMPNLEKTSISVQFFMAIIQFRYKVAYGQRFHYCKKVQDFVFSCTFFITIIFFSRILTKLYSL